MSTSRRVRALHFVIAVLGPACLVTAAPILTLAVNGPSNATSPGSASMDVVATNTEFVLGGLSYTLRFEVLGAPTAMTVTSREYSAFGWVANDGLFDNSNPSDGAGLSVLTNNVNFDTVFSPAGTGRSDGTTGGVDQLSFNIPAGLTPGTLLDIRLVSISASDPNGNDLVTTLQGSATFPQILHRILIPEPSTVWLLCIAGSMSLRRCSARR